MNIPNLLTTLRLCLMPVFLIVYFSPFENARLWAMGVLVLSFLTDVLDGFIARHFNQISNLGKILDPVADKVMQITVLLCLAFSNHALIWVVVFVFVKDAILGIGSIYMHRRGIVAQANWFGKVSCFVSVLCSLVLIIPFSTPLSAEVVIALGAAIVAVNLCALISYVVVFFRTAFKRPKIEKNPKS